MAEIKTATTKKPSLFELEFTFSKVFNDKFKEQLYSEFYTLIDSGVDMQKALQLIIEEQEKEKTKAVLVQLQHLLIKGSSLSDAMKTLGHFTSYEYQSIKIGEESGRLKQVLQSLTLYFSEKVKLKRQLISVFTYPVFVLLITLGVLYFMLNSVVPMFEDVFKQFGEELPWLTKQIIWLSEHFSNFLLLFVILTVGFGIYFYSQRKEVWFRKQSSSFVLKIPIFGILIRKIYIARFCQTMALLIEAKTPLVRALDLVQEMIGFYPLEVAISNAKSEILAGNPLYSGLGKYKLFDKRLISLVKIAEEINQLDKTFNRLSKQYAEEIEYRTKLMGTIIEPAIIIIIGLLVGLIMVAMYLPMFNLSNVIK